jgi:phosphoribosylformylglycinamidine synthase subunit PurL
MSAIRDTEVSTLEMAKSIGLSIEEYNHVCARLERKPSYAELGVFSAMFSEHCSYKSSKKYLKRFPTTGKRVVQGPGENAGIVDIGEGWAVAFKMESHNHPSYIEPYQGAATGMGGILRDIFTMGAKPIASMNALSFGSADLEKTAQLIKGVVRGIGDYGNCVGVPTLAGQTFFHPCYNQNPLVNAFTLGIVRHDKIFLGYASGIGNLVVYVGAKTGRDGVHGATMASREFSTEKEPERPTVQVGDPFTEKLLLEATLEAMKLGLIVGIQDMGAAGLTSSSFEMAHRAKTGLEIDLNRVPARETGMSAYELLLSESQERMLLVCTSEQWVPLKKVFDKWDLHAEEIGRVVEGNRVKMTYHDAQVIDLPVELVAEPLIADRPRVMPSDIKQRWFIDRNRMLSASLEAKFEAAFSDINFADPRRLVEQYDSTVGNRTQGDTFDDAAVIRLRDCPEKNIKLALAVDCNPRVCWLWPREGGKRAVAESALNLAVRGAEPIGVTDCLNFGSPENPEVMWQFEECIEGISETCERLKIPVVSGNVSFYNETDGVPISPTPMIGMVGLIEDQIKLPHSSFFSTQSEIALVGPREGGLGGSVLAFQWFKRDCGKPEETDLSLLERTLKFCYKLRRFRANISLHDISDGGLVLAALEMAFHCPYKEIGLELNIPHETDVDRFLFGEGIPRLLVAYDPVEKTELETLASRSGVTFTPIGVTTDKSELKIFQGGATVLKTGVAELKARWSEKWKTLFEG